MTRSRTLIPACDVPQMDRFLEIVRHTCDLEGIGGYKLGFPLALRYGLPLLVSRVREITDKPLIYDHQKGATDIPDMGREFARVMRDSGIDYAIIFPMTGPLTLKAWIEALREEEVEIIVGGLMTHKGYTEQEGGFLRQQAPEEIYRAAADLGVTSFVVPGTRVEEVRRIRQLLNSLGLEPEFFSPGFGAQGGELPAYAEAAGKKWHIIVGRSITGADDIRGAAMQQIDLIDRMSVEV